MISARGNLVVEDDAVGGDVFGLLVDAAAVLAELHDVADVVGGDDEVDLDDRLAEFLDVAGSGSSAAESMIWIACRRRMTTS